MPPHLLPPPPPTDNDYDDRVQCPHCLRKVCRATTGASPLAWLCIFSCVWHVQFNATAAERHIPKCSSIRAKPKTLVRGAGPGLQATRGAGRQYVL